MTPRDGIERDPYAEPHSWEYPAMSGPAAEGTGRPAAEDRPAGHGEHGGHGLMMICCVPMVVVAVALVATGVVGSSIIVPVLLCTAMMAAMMLAMPGAHGGK